MKLLGTWSHGPEVFFRYKVKLDENLVIEENFSRWKKKT